MREIPMRETRIRDTSMQVLTMRRWQAIDQVAKYEKWLLPSGDKFTASGQTVSNL